ncbi:hypothetical protein [Sulfuricurvum sp.]|uniref:hypothetical protein n=1 Tax=Sulfuricurvum sp. TaxID=2025608 RepID=UPI0026085B24|nr:hypothetical protein [Sulfuricurvum sp.]MDD2782112.1 hypothetical protein [Sulfuricurvum sp.]
MVTKNTVDLTKALLDGIEKDMQTMRDSKIADPEAYRTLEKNRDKIEKELEEAKEELRAN